VTVDGLLVPIQNTDPAAPPVHQIVPFKAILDNMKNPRSGPGIAWQHLQDGVAYAAVPFVERPSHGDGLLHVVRIDPRRARVLAFTSGSEDIRPQTAADWATQRKLAVVINAGMYEPDHLTHTGYFRVEGQTNSAQWLPSYKSALLLPGRAAEASAQIIDLDREDSSSLMKREGAVAQNLRLIRAPGINMWPQNQKRWSEAAIAMTKDGEILFLFSRSPLSMRDFNTKLLDLGLGVVRAMHAEGGPEASLSIHAGGIGLDLCGSYETGFVENDDNHHQWPLPNVFGIEVDRSGP
jgi:uncharacterized protein YigE (DUF2233 family)